MAWAHPDVSLEDDDEVEFALVDSWTMDESSARPGADHSVEVGEFSAAHSMFVEVVAEDVEETLVPEVSVSTTVDPAAAFSALSTGKSKHVHKNQRQRRELRASREEQHLCDFLEMIRSDLKLMTSI